MLPPAENPLCFGHTGPQQQFLNALYSHRLPHGWIIVGPQGVGKRTFCYQLIRFLFSRQQRLSPQDPLFRRIASRSHGDLWVLEKDAAPLGVDDVRSIKGFLQKTTLEGGWRIVLLDGVETLNRFGANALLKSLEEPPPQTLFFLTAQTLHGILPTLRSRCQILFLKPLEKKEVENALTQMGYKLSSEEKAAVISLARGCIGRATFLLQEERWKKVLAFRTILLRACLPPLHARYEAPFTDGNIALLTGEPLSFWEETGVDWLESLLKKSMGGQVMSSEEKEVFRQASLPLWWYRRDQIKAQFQRARHSYLDPLHSLTIIFHFLTN